MNRRYFEIKVLMIMATIRFILIQFRSILLGFLFNADSRIVNHATAHLVC